MSDRFIARAPGRVNLIGDHTDYAGGLALPCAIDLGVTITGRFIDHRIEVSSDVQTGSVSFDLDDPPDIATLEPTWGRYIAAVREELPTPRGIDALITSDLPVGAGLSSSAALEIATALALGFDGAPMELALLGQRSEHRAVGVPCGLLDQLSITFGRAGHAMLIDFTDLSIDQVAFPDDLDIVVVHSGEERRLVDSQYAERRASCERAARIIGPLATATPDDLDQLDDHLRRRARHVVTECERVRQAAAALRSGDATTVGRLMAQSHASLRDDFEVSTPTLDELVDRMASTPGVFGARLTGAGFGGCVVALCARGAIADANSITGRGWIVRPSDAATLRLV